MSELFTRQSENRIVVLKNLTLAYLQCFKDNYIYIYIYIHMGIETYSIFLKQNMYFFFVLIYI